MAKTFDSDFGEVMQNMKRHVDAIDPTAMLGAHIEARNHHEGKRHRIRSYHRVLLTVSNSCYRAIAGFERGSGARRSTSST